MGEITCTQTQEWIISALLSLMNKKNYREITIVDIVSEAHIGRRTFYRNFRSQKCYILLGIDYLNSW
ncbi:TetR/AcrR family transcriptional regulator [Clostridium intestinale]|uniref:TetR/AcrR family transcriptional regulator n=1 Tax=Clostridium intestinale TaxID=36845 RepID=UPI003B213E50